jgi:hypothetical protein
MVNNWLGSILTVLRIGDIAMASSKYDHIDQFLEEAEAYIIPEEYISAACVTDIDGNEYRVTFEEVAEILGNGPLKDQGIVSVKAIINMEVVKKDVMALTDEILSYAQI